MFQFTALPIGLSSSPRIFTKVLNPSVSVSAVMTIIDFTLCNARRFYSSMGNPSDTEGLSQLLLPLDVNLDIHVWAT